MKGQIKFSVPDLPPKCAVMWKEREESKDRRIDKIVKDKDAPSSDFFHQDVRISWMKNQAAPREWKAGSEKRVNFTDIYKGRKKFLPGVGHYKDDIKVLDRLSKSPTKIKK